MTTFLDDDNKRTSTPVVKRQRIGERFVGALVRYEQRDVLKRNERTQEMEKQLKPNGKPRQELVVHCVAMPGTTSPAGLGDDTRVPEPGTIVRLILRGGAFGDWIEARKDHRGGKIAVGDIVTQTVEYAQAWNPDGTTKGGKITDQAQADAVPRGTSVGFYGPLTLHVPDPAKHAQWITAAEQAHREATTTYLDEGAAGGGPFEDEEPF